MRRSHTTDRLTNNDLPLPTRMLARRSVLYALAASTLASCAQAPSRRLSDASTEIRSLRVYAYGPRDPALVGGSGEAFTATLQRNGLPVAKYLVLDRPLPDVAALARLRDAAAEPNDASHSLVLTAQNRQSSGGAEYVRYEAVLWDARQRRLVWTVSLASLLSRKSPERAERLAADTLRALAREKLIELKPGAPRDAAGSEISPTWLPYGML